MAKEKASSKDPAAVALGSRGGKATALSLSAAQRKASAKKAINARWDRWRAEHPKKKKAGKSK